MHLLCMMQHVVLARQLNQPVQHLPLKGLSPQQQSQVLTQYNHDQHRGASPLQPMVSLAHMMLTSHSCASSTLAWSCCLTQPGSVDSMQSCTACARHARTRNNCCAAAQEAVRESLWLHNHAPHTVIKLLPCHLLHGQSMQVCLFPAESSH